MLYHINPCFGHSHPGKPSLAWMFTFSLPNGPLQPPIGSFYSTAYLEKKTDSPSYNLQMLFTKSD